MSPQFIRDSINVSMFSKFLVKYLVFSIFNSILINKLSWLNKRATKLTVKIVLWTPGKKKRRRLVFGIQFS